jgi:hypothetical protein
MHYFACDQNERRHPDALGPVFDPATCTPGFLEASYESMMYHYHYRGIG